MVFHGDDEHILRSCRVAGPGLSSFGNKAHAEHCVPTFLRRMYEFLGLLQIARNESTQQRSVASQKTNIGYIFRPIRSVAFDCALIALISRQSPLAYEELAYEELPTRNLPIAGSGAQQQ